MDDASTWVLILDKAVIPVLVTVLTPILLALVSKALDMVRMKWNFEIEEKQRAAIDQMVIDAIHYAEEQSRKRLNGATDEAEFTGAEKMDSALSYMKLRGAELNLDKLLKNEADELASLIETKLNQNRD